MDKSSYCLWSVSKKKHDKIITANLMVTVSHFYCTIYNRYANGWSIK